MKVLEMHLDRPRRLFKRNSTGTHKAADGVELVTDPLGVIATLKGEREMIPWAQIWKVKLEPVAQEPAKPAAAPSGGQQQRR